MIAYPERNLLANALSPYLLQHADNPVHWREWGPDALAEAEATRKPILLSVGYAACHWCHVMAHESFENEATAALMNAFFVNIKVDREERPDIDQLYMNALHGMGEQGGWPLTMFLTPAGRPFWGGTYFPGESRYGRPGFPDVLKAIHHLYENDPEKVSGNAEAIGNHLARLASGGSGRQAPVPSELDEIAERLLGACDPDHGGIGQAPKFPSHAMWENLWRAWVRSRDSRYRDACLHWLSAMCRGGIYDHLGGGLHRYTVDARWLVPHFEKMLYDNAQFVRALSVGYGASGDPLFRSRLEQTVTFLLTAMRGADGGFTSSFDADSEGGEGLYYVWAKSEIDRILGPDSAAFCEAYDVTESGNWEGRNILNRLENRTRSQRPGDTFLQSCRNRLLAVRQDRTPPAVDDKILVDWNALAIRALVDAGQCLDRTDLVRIAETTFDFVTGSITRNGRLGHAYRDGRTAFPGLSTDLAGMINAAVSLYGATGKTRFIENARRFAAELDTWHGDGSGNYTLAASDQESVPIRAFSDHDEAVPSATAAASEALFRLALADSDAAMTARAGTTLANAWARVHSNPFGAIGIVNAADTMIRAPKLVTTGKEDAFSTIRQRNPDPARFDTHTDAVHRHLGPGVAAAANAAYLCRGTACSAPVFDDSQLEALLTAPARA